jgi:hypothetical protein
MRTLLTILFFGWLLQPLFGQHKADTAFSLLRTYNGDIANAALDNLNNLYLISSNGQIRKYNANGDSLGIYNQVRNFGQLYSVDVSNPLQPLLFYKDFSTIVLLDRFLANRTTIDLRRSGILQPGAAGISYDNNIWVYDEWDNKLKKLNDQGALLLETADFRTAFSQTLRPQRIIDNNTMVYLADSSAGIFVFDIYGTFKKRINLLHWNSVTIKDNFIVSAGQKNISAYNMQTHIEKQVLLPSFSSSSFRSIVMPSRLVAFSKDTLHIYSYRF